MWTTGVCAAFLIILLAQYVKNLRLFVYGSFKKCLIFSKNQISKSVSGFIDQLFIFGGLIVVVEIIITKLHVFKLKGHLSLRYTLKENEFSFKKQSSYSKPCPFVHIIALLYQGFIS